MLDHGSDGGCGKGGSDGGSEDSGDDGESKGAHVAAMAMASVEPVVKAEDAADAAAGGESNAGEGDDDGGCRAEG